MFSTEAFAAHVSRETGFPFLAAEGTATGGRRLIELIPAGHPKDQTFVIRCHVGWRRLDFQFRLGKFAGELLLLMKSADGSGRRLFLEMVRFCEEGGASVRVRLNGQTIEQPDESMWETPWRTFELDVTKGMLDINLGDDGQDERQVAMWGCRVAAAVIALLPLEEVDSPSEELVGFPEGAKARLEVNSYERDRRNRVAALSIHGYSCHACRKSLSDIYGPVAEGVIEVHHVVPVARLGENYVVDPRKDLVPLCPDCHTIAHRRTPPYSIEELRTLLAWNSGRNQDS